PNALVLKTSVGKLTEGSNPSVSAKFLCVSRHRSAWRCSRFLFTNWVQKNNTGSKACLSMKTNKPLPAKKASRIAEDYFIFQSLPQSWQRAVLTFLVLVLWVPLDFFQTRLDIPRVPHAVMVRAVLCMLPPRPVPLEAVRVPCSTKLIWTFAPLQLGQFMRKYLFNFHRDREYPADQRE